MLFHCRRRRRRSSRGSYRSSTNSSVDVPPAALLETIISPDSGKHVAKTYEDTTEGAVHCFQDEHGKICI